MSTSAHPGYNLFLLALALFVLIAPGSCRHDFPPGLANEDFVVALPSATHRARLFYGSRCWRLGIRTFGAMNCTDSSQLRPLPSRELYKEHVECFPDEYHEKKQGAAYHSIRPGDVRAAVVPFLAHRHYNQSGQEYKWMLYGALLG